MERPSLARSAQLRYGLIWRAFSEGSWLQQRLKELMEDPSG